MKWLIGVLIVVLAYLQYRLWVGEGSFAHLVRLNQEIENQQAENDGLKERNRLLAAEVDALKNGYRGIEGRARRDMGMVKEGETFYLIVDESKAASK